MTPAAHKLKSRVAACLDLVLGRSSPLMAAGRLQMSEADAARLAVLKRRAALRAIANRLILVSEVSGHGQRLVANGVQHRADGREMQALLRVAGGFAGVGGCHHLHVDLSLQGIHALHLLGQKECDRVAKRFGARGVADPVVHFSCSVVGLAIAMEARPAESWERGSAGQSGGDL